MPGGIFENSVPSGARYRQDTARLVHHRFETEAIIRPTDETKERIVGVVARVNNPVEIVDGGDQRSAESPRCHIEWRVEDIEGLPAEKWA